MPLLRTLGVFRLIGLAILKASGKSRIMFILILSFISWFLALAVDEATSIIYVLTLLLDIKKLTGKDIKPLVILAVLATNTGSQAMPIGNPIGVYLAFTVGLHAFDFMVHALPLSLITLLSLIFTAYYLLRESVKEIIDVVTYEKINIVFTEFYTKIKERGKFPLIYGLSLLIGFLITVSSSKYLAVILQGIYGETIDPQFPISVHPVYIYLLIFRGV